MKMLGCNGHRLNNCSRFGLVGCSGDDWDFNNWSWGSSWRCFFFSLLMKIITNNTHWLNISSCYSILCHSRNNWYFRWSSNNWTFCMLFLTQILHFFIKWHFILMFLVIHFLHQIWMCVVMMLSKRNVFLLWFLSHSLNCGIFIFFTEWWEVICRHLSI